MAEYPSIVLTNSGLEMIAESQAGQNLIFTKLKIGDGTLATGESISTLTGVKSPKFDVPIQGFTNQGNGQVRLRYLVDNSGVAVNQGFFAREVGIYAKIGEAGTERLYAYTNGGNKVDWIPDKNTLLDAQIFDVFVLIGNASNVTVVINGSATYATKLDLTEHEDDENAHGEIIAAHNTDEHAHARLLRLWQPNKNYVIGDTYRPLTLSYPSWIYLECIQGGGSGATEPVWPAVGQEITDGTVKWRVRDIKSGGGVTIGTITPRLALHPEPGELACDTGALVSRATYPDLWAWVQANAPLVTEEVWQAQAAVQNSVGCYSSGDGSTTFRLPRILDYSRGGHAENVGQWQGDAIRNITGNMTFYEMINYIPSGGAFNAANTPGANNGRTSGNTGGSVYITFDASRIVPVADENRPKTIKFLYCVKAFDAVTNPGLLDIGVLAADVTALSGAKLNKSDYNLKAWVNFNGTGVVAIRASFNVSSITDNGTGDYTVNFINPLAHNNYAVHWDFEGVAVSGYVVTPKAYTLTPTSVRLTNGMVAGATSPADSAQNFVSIHG